MRSSWVVMLLAACGDDGGARTDDDGMTDEVADLDTADADDVTDEGILDAPPDSGERSYNCGTFTEDPGWTLTPGFHAVVVADASDGLGQPVAAVVAGGAFGGLIYVVNQSTNSIVTIEPTDGAATVFAPSTAFSRTPGVLSTIEWDVRSVFDGNLYVGDLGSDADSDSAVFRITPAATVTTFAAGPGPGLDDIFGLAFSASAEFGAKLYVSGDTDGANVDWGAFDSTGVATAFSELPGVEGLVFDTSGDYGGGLLASRPNGGGYAGDDSITKVGPDGIATGNVVMARTGIHAVTIAPPGPFQGHLVAASWATQELISVDPAGVVSVLASGLQLTNYDGNILAFSPDGRVLYVADRSANRLVCIEPI